MSSRRSSTRRGIVLAAVATGMSAVLGITPAHASFGTTARVPAMTVGTASVTAPTGVTGSVSCGPSNSTVTVTWTASTTAQVSGYQIIAYFSDGYTQTMSAAATATRWSGSVSTYYVTATTVHLTVTTQTSYGWTKQSSPTAELSC